MASEEQVVENETSVNDTVAELIKTLTDEKKHLDEVLKTTISSLKNLQREVKKMKPKKKNKQTDETREKRTSGLDKPVVVSSELRELLGLEDKEYPRSSVTSMVTAYIKTNNLQNPSNKREMLLDGSEEGVKLNAVLKPDQPVTFFNLQRFLKPHLSKPPEDTSLADKNQEYVDKMVESLNELVQEMPEPSHSDVDEPKKKVVRKKVFKTKN